MFKHTKPRSLLVVISMTLALFAACHSGNTKEKGTTEDSSSVALQDSLTTESNGPDSSSGKTTEPSNVNPAKTAQSTVLIYNFHVTNRCPSCIAIEEATTKVLNAYFAKEVKQGRIKRQILNVDDEANSKIAEKYEVFGSGCIVSRRYKGKETTTDFTGDGFKYAKNKEEKFIEILKNKITEYLN